MPKRKGETDLQYYERVGDMSAADLEREEISARRQYEISRGRRPKGGSPRRRGAQQRGPELPGLVRDEPRKRGFVGRTAAAGDELVVDDQSTAFRSGERNLERRMKPVSVRRRSGDRVFNVEVDGKFAFPALAQYIEIDAAEARISINNSALELHDDARREVMAVLSREAVRSVKGAPSILKSAGRYPRGILRGKGPDGRMWDPLEDSTLWFRYLKAGGKGGESYQYSVMAEFPGSGDFFDPETGHGRRIGSARGQSFKLRETSKHIYGGLKPLEVTQGHFEIGWDGYHEDTGEPVAHIALKQHRGFTTVWTAAQERGYTGGMKRRFRVPARPFIGLQPQFFENADEIAETLIRWHMFGDVSDKRLQTIRRRR